MKKILHLLTLLLITQLGFSQNALNFDGTGDYVQTNYDGVLGTNARTFEAWIKLDTSALATSNYCILDYGPGSAGERNTFFAKGDGKIGFLSGGTNANLTSAAGVFQLGTWTHVAFVLNSGTGYLYVNAVQVATGNLSSVNTGTGGTKLRIGEKVPSNSIAFKGLIDEVRVWDVARTSVQMAADTGAEFCSLQNNLKAYYRFNEGVAGGTNTGVTTVIDYAGTNNGTFNGFALTGTTSNYDAGYLTTLGYSKSIFKDTGCVSYTDPNGNIYTTTGVYYDTLTNSVSCDSLVQFDIEISGAVDDSIYSVGGRMTSYDTWAAHQWVRCDSGYAPISGATNSFYIATLPGDYACIVTRGVCTDTTDCININPAGLDENEISGFELYPNPASQSITVKNLTNRQISELLILDISGKTVLRKTTNTSRKIDIHTLDKGVYLMKIVTSKGVSTIKFVKQ